MSLRRAFAGRFSQTPRVFRAPGRINLIGEHTDYNQGFVMPAAIDLATWTAAAPRTDRRVEAVSRTVSGEASFDLDDTALRPRGAWIDYVAGVARVLEQAGHRLRGANLMIDSTVPLGSGLSSSASLEISVALALLGVSGVEGVDRLSIARAAQRAEHEWAGARCGLMDQFAACFGRAGHALLLDCRSLEFRPVPIPPEIRVVVANTMVRRELAQGEYNQRRADCEEAAHLLGVSSLRDVGPASFASRQAELPPVIRRRARHVVTENARTVEAAAALEQGDLCRAGALLAASHRSLRDDFEVSCAELDAMVGAAALPGVLGSRMMGGGFGGCTITLVRAEAAEDAIREMAFRYHLATDIEPKIHVCRAVDGAAEEEEEEPAE